MSMCCKYIVHKVLKTGWRGSRHCCCIPFFFLFNTILSFFPNYITLAGAPSECLYLTMNTAQRNQFRRQLELLHV